jgi:D-proline reductase (dithiol) PrdB
VSFPAGFHASGRHPDEPCLDYYNFDRAGFQRDLNVVYPIDRLRELAAAGVIGGVAETHFTVMGSTDPAGMTTTADQIAGQLRQERIDSILLSPV